MSQKTVTIPGQLFLLFFVLNFLAIAGFPYLDKLLNPLSAAPSLITYAGTGISLVLITGGALYWGVQSGFSIFKNVLF